MATSIVKKIHEPTVIPRESAPCKEVIIPQDQIHLSKIPNPVWHPKDGGLYIAMGIQITKDPETGAPNASIIRQMVVGKQEICIQLLPGKFWRRLSQVRPKKMSWPLPEA